MAQPAQPVVIHAAEGEHFWGLRACTTIKIRAEQTDGRLGMLEVLMPPQAGPPLHIHHNEDETIHVLEGQVRVACGDTETVLDVGSFAFLPRGIPHAFWVLGDRPALIQAIFVPGGVEAVFADGGQATGKRALPEPGAVKPGAFSAQAESYNIEDVGPPLGA